MLMFLGLTVLSGKTTSFTLFHLVVVVLSAKPASAKKVILKVIYRNPNFIKQTLHSNSVPNLFVIIVSKVLTKEEDFIVTV